MGLLSCYNFQERLMPYVRAETARRLAKAGLRQSRIAEHLGVSQAMISKYLHGPARVPDALAVPAVQTVVDRAVEGVLDQESKGRLPEWCPLCPELWARGAPRLLPEATADECLRGESLPGRDQAAAVIEDVAAAVRRLEGAAFAPLAPAVNVNIAMALPDARDARGVAALPGRLVEARGELRAVGAPEFGASKHLSHILLKTRKAAPDLRAVMCLRDSEETRRALRAAGLTFRVLKRVRRELVIAARPMKGIDALIDPGDFGIEPITYLFGATATDVVDKAERIVRSPKANPRSETP